MHYSSFLTSVIMFVLNVVNLLQDHGAYDLPPKTAFVVASFFPLILSRLLTDFPDHSLLKACSLVDAHLN